VRSFAKHDICRPQAFSLTIIVQAFSMTTVVQAILCAQSDVWGCMYQIVTVPVLLLHLSCSILGSNAGRQQAVTLLYKLCDFTCKRDLQHTQQVSRCCDGTSILVAHIHQAVINDGCDQCSCIHIFKCLSRDMTRLQVPCIMSTLLLTFVARTSMLPQLHSTAQPFQV